MKQATPQDRTLGLILGVLSAIFVAGYVTTNKYIYSHFNVGAVEYSQIFAVAGGFFALLSLAKQLNSKNRAVIRQNFWPLIGLGVAGTTAVSVLVIGQQYTTAVNASMLMTSTIVATALFSHYLLNERHNRHQYIWILALFIGLYIGVVGLRSLHFQKGDVIVLASVLFFGFGNVYSRILMKRIGNSKLVPDVRLTVAGVIALSALFFLVKDFDLILSIMPWALVAGAFYWLCMKSFAKAVYLLDANQAIVLNNSQIFFTSLIGVLLLSENYSWEKFAGSMIAIISIYCITYKK